jgi:hypothetical protein
MLTTILNSLLFLIFFRWIIERENSFFIQFEEEIHKFEEEKKIEKRNAIDDALSSAKKENDELKSELLLALREDKKKR